MKFKIKGQTLTMTLSQEEIALIVDSLETAALVEGDSTEPDEAKLAGLTDCIACFKEFSQEEYAINP